MQTLLTLPVFHYNSFCGTLWVTTATTSSSAIFCYYYYSCYHSYYYHYCHHHQRHHYHYHYHYHHHLRACTSVVYPRVENPAVSQALCKHAPQSARKSTLKPIPVQACAGASATWGMRASGLLLGLRGLHQCTRKALRSSRVMETGMIKPIQR